MKAKELKFPNLFLALAILLVVVATYSTVNTYAPNLLKLPSWVGQVHNDGDD